MLSTRQENIRLVRQKTDLEEINEELGLQLDKSGIPRPVVGLISDSIKAEELQRRQELQMKEKLAQERAERQKLLRKGLDFIDGDNDF